MEKYLVQVGWMERHVEQVPTGAECALDAAIAAVDSMREGGRGGCRWCAECPPWRLRGSRVWAPGAFIAGGDQGGLQGAN